MSMEKCQRGLYDPALGEINFIVPDVNILAKSVTGVGKKIEPGIIPQAIELLDAANLHTLSCDAKKVRVT